jgi:hypothetical protein
VDAARVDAARGVTRTNRSRDLPTGTAANRWIIVDTLVDAVVEESGLADLGRNMLHLIDQWGLADLASVLSEQFGDLGLTIPEPSEEFEDLLLRVLEILWPAVGIPARLIDSVTGPTQPQSAFVPMEQNSAESITAVTATETMLDLALASWDESQGLAAADPDLDRPIVTLAPIAAVADEQALDWTIPLGASSTESAGARAVDLRRGAVGRRAWRGCRQRCKTIAQWPTHSHGAARGVRSFTTFGI